MNSQDADKSYEIFSSELFGQQKVKLFEIQHIIFDFGGVLAERSFILKNLLDNIENDLGIKIPRNEDVYYRKIKRQLSSGRITSREFLELIIDKYYYPFQKVNGALPAKKVNIDYYLELWFQMHIKLTKLSKDMRKIIKRFHNAGYTVNLMSNVYDLYAKSYEIRGFYNLFDNVFLSNEIGVIKPDIDKYKYVLNKLSAKPKECIFIDDKIQNLVPARTLGMIVVNFKSFKKFTEQLDCLGFNEVSKRFRKEINQKYQEYRMKKKQYKRSRKAYKKSRRAFLNKKGKSEKELKEFKQKQEEYHKLKLEFQKIKEIKKHELIAKCELD
ncbi:MAG: hypothetical protein EU529_12405 [Promethearchaeota archaeon]|nr:MAG: hypothetical protein EU529_12405 [Candidatus Lokiarchaeota archaeon]